MDDQPHADGQLRRRRRHLPHWERDGAVYFLTWRCAQGVALDSVERQEVVDALLHWDGRRYTLWAATVLPDHVHALLRPLAADVGGGPTPLASFTHGLKSFTANRINARSGRRGRAWQDESFDRIVRGDRELAETVKYIRHNAVAGGLAGRPEEYKGLLMRRD